jgi:hypothetical protein
MHADNGVSKVSGRRPVCSQDLPDQVVERTTGRPATSDDVPRQLIQPHTIGVHRRSSTFICVGVLTLAMLPASNRNTLTHAL